MASRSAIRSSASAIFACASPALACASATFASASRKRAFASSLRASSSLRAASSSSTTSRSSCSFRSSVLGGRASAVRSASSSSLPAEISCSRCDSSSLDGGELVSRGVELLPDRVQFLFLAAGLGLVPGDGGLERLELLPARRDELLALRQLLPHRPQLLTGGLELRAGLPDLLVLPAELRRVIRDGGPQRLQLLGGHRGGGLLEQHLVPDRGQLVLHPGDRFLALGRTGLRARDLLVRLGQIRSAAP